MPTWPYSHGFLILTIEKQLYIYDTGYAQKSPRWPLPINLDQKVQIIDAFPGEKYKIELVDDIYILSMWVKEDWMNYYAIRKEFTTCSVEHIEFKYHELLTTKEHRNARDKFVLASRNTDFGRYCFYFEPKAKPFYSYKRVIEYGIVETSYH